MEVLGLVVLYHHGVLEAEHLASQRPSVVSWSCMDDAYDDARKRKELSVVRNLDWCCIASLSENARCSYSKAISLVSSNRP